MWFRYSRWDGSQEVSPFSADDLMDAMADDLISDGDLRSALQRLFRWGSQNPQGEHMKGVQDVLEQLRERKQQELNRYRLDSMLEDLEKRLNDVLQTERDGIQRRLEQARTGQSPNQDNPSQSTPNEGDPGDSNSDSADQNPSGQNPATSGRQSPGQPSSQQSPSRSPGESGQSGESPNTSPSGNSPSGDSQSGDSSAEAPPESLRRLLESMAQRKLNYLDQLPPDFAGRMKALTNHEFMDPEAQRKFQELLKLLEQQILGNRFEGIKQSMENLRPEDLQQLREMIRDLNQMLQEKLRGGNPDFQAFKDKHGQFFPPDINSLDDLIQHLQQSSAQMQSLLDSLSPEMRGQLQQVMDNLLRDDRLKWDLAQLGANLDRLLPSRQFRNRYPFRGDEDVTLQEAMDLMQQLQDLDQLERQLKRINSAQNLQDVDLDQVEQLLGPEARQTLEQLRQLMQVLEEAGYVRKTDRGYELSSRGMRRIGQKALQDIFDKLKRDAFGKHAVDQRGAGGERTHDNKPYEFGDAFHLDLQHTMMNSLVREGPGSPLRLAPTDFEVYRTELTTTSSTVLMVDMSRSMILRGCFVAAKKVAIALDSLIRGQYPNDNLYFIAFSDYARELKPDELPAVEWDESVYGTNMHHAFMLARKLLDRHKGTNKQIIMITDGEPTAHLEGARAIFSYPPSYRTITETLKEVTRCTRDQIVINTFMLERGHYLVDFINQVTRINRGRAFFSAPERLGEYILVDYVNSKRKLVK
ncbi:MAG TPA: VWA domain-containing protein [Chloroflexota bacterium]|nr:VWA domain-containing protein [Chloroflexota bacterium]